MASCSSTLPKSPPLAFALCQLSRFARFSRTKIDSVMWHFWPTKRFTSPVAKRQDAHYFLPAGSFEQ